MLINVGPFWPPTIKSLATALQEQIKIKLFIHNSLIKPIKAVLIYCNVDAYSINHFRILQ